MTSTREHTAIKARNSGICSFLRTIGSMLMLCLKSGLILLFSKPSEAIGGRQPMTIMMTNWGVQIEDVTFVCWQTSLSVECDINDYWIIACWCIENEIEIKIKYCCCYHLLKLFSVRNKFTSVIQLLMVQNILQWIMWSFVSGACC